MDNKYLPQLLLGAQQWNEWREKNWDKSIRFNGLKTELKDFNFNDSNLSQLDFYECDLTNCEFSESALTGVDFMRCNLSNSNFYKEVRREDKRLFGVNLRWVRFGSCDLSGCNFTNATLEGAQFVECNLSNTTFKECMIFGVGIWNCNFENSIQETLYASNLTKDDFIVEDLETACLLYGFLENQRIARAIDAISGKTVLILGNFSPNEIKVLNSIKEGIKKHKHYLPVLFDFKQPNSRTLSETVTAMAYLSKFVIADLTNQKSIPHELGLFLEKLRNVPLIPIIKKGNKPYSMFNDYFKGLNHIAEIIEYEEHDDSYLLTKKIITIAEELKEKIN